VSILPSAASLKALRGFARKEQSTKPMTGFGDPIFNPAVKPGDGSRPARTTARSVATGAYSDFWQGAGVDRARLSDALSQLPDTADELNAIAKNLGVAASDIHLGEDASETTLKRTRLADYGIVYFATHGLVAGDVKGLAEPSLVLSLPKQPTEFDDGLLTASEARRRSALRLSAIVLLCRRAGAAGVALGGQFRGGDAAFDIDLRPAEGRSQAWPRRGAASGHAGLSQRCVLAPQCLSGVLGAVCTDR
jgi:hypothetical protein